MKTYIQKIKEKYNFILNALIAIVIAGLIIWFFETETLKRITEKEFNQISLITSLVILGKYFLLIYCSSNKKVSFVDFISVNTLVYTIIIITYLFLEKSNVGKYYFFAQGVHIVMFILNSFILFTRFNVLKTNKQVPDLPISETKYEQNLEKTDQIDQKIDQKPVEMPVLEEIREDLVEEVPDSKNNLLTEALEIDENTFIEYRNTLIEFFTTNNIQYGNIYIPRNEIILKCLFNKFESSNLLKEFLEYNLEAIKNKASLNLNIYEAITLLHLITVYPKFKDELIQNSEYYLVNDSSSYLYKLKINQTNLYEIERRRYFDEINLQYPGVIKILENIYQEVSNYLNNKVNKKIQKIEYGRAESKSCYDLFVSDYSFDYLKARRQVTKFIEQYNNAITPADHSKIYKEFITVTFKTDYAPTLFPYLSTLSNRIQNKSKLILDIAKKSNFLQSKDQLQLNNLNKAVNSIVIIFDELSTQEKAKVLTRLYAKNEDLMFLDCLYNALIEQYGYNDDAVKLTEELLKTNMLTFINDKKDYLGSKSFSIETFQLLTNYLKGTSELSSFIMNSINSETINYLVIGYAICKKNKNNYHYLLDSKGLNQFINKTDIIKLMKEKEETNKQNLLIDLVKNKEINCRISLDPKKI